MPSKSATQKRSSKALAKRVKVLEIKQKADDKSTERKVQYYNSLTTMNSVWSSNYDFVIRTSQGTQATGTVSSAGLTRIGNQINLRSCVINFHCAFPRNSDGAPVAAGSTRCRLILVDNLTGVESLAISDILENPTYKMTSPYKRTIARGERYRVLGDFKFNLNTHNKNDHSFKFKMPLPKTGRVLNYNANSDTNPSDFNITMLWACEDVGPLSGNQPTLQYYVKSVFEDK